MVASLFVLPISASVAPRNYQVPRSGSLLNLYSMQQTVGRGINYTRNHPWIVAGAAARGFGTMMSVKSMCMYAAAFNQIIQQSDKDSCLRNPFTYLALGAVAAPLKGLMDPTISNKDKRDIIQVTQLKLAAAPFVFGPELIVVSLMAYKGLDQVAKNYQYTIDELEGRSRFEQFMGIGFRDSLKRAALDHAFSEAVKFYGAQYDRAHQAEVLPKQVVEQHPQGNALLSSQELLDRFNGNMAAIGAAIH